MNFKNSNLRFAELKDGHLCVCKLDDDVNWNKTGVVLGVYFEGHFYDAQCKEEDMLDREWHKLTYEDGLTCVNGFAFTGVNVVDINSDVLD